MENWDQETLERAVAEKHGAEAGKPNKTKIICKFFLDAVEKRQYGWFWKCPNGEACIYRHALPPGYVLKSEMQQMLAEEKANQARREPWRGGRGAGRGGGVRAAWRVRGDEATRRRVVFAAGGYLGHSRGRAAEGGRQDAHHGGGVPGVAARQGRGAAGEARQGARRAVAGGAAHGEGDIRVGWVCGGGRRRRGWWG